MWPAAPAPDDLVDIDETLDHLERLHPRMARVHTLCFFGGFDDACLADILHASPPAVARDLAAAKQVIF